MARVTDAEVEAIVDYDDNITLTPFINIANQLVTELCSDSNYSDNRLLEIERWLSGHFYVMRDQTFASTKAGSVAASYQYQIGLFFKQSKQGQTALALDTDGNLAKLGKQMEDGKGGSVVIGWMGQDYDTEDTTD